MKRIVVDVIGYRNDNGYLSIYMKMTNYVRHIVMTESYIRGLDYINNGVRKFYFGGVYDCTGVKRPALLDPLNNGHWLLTVNTIHRIQQSYATQQTEQLDIALAA